ESSGCGTGPRPWWPHTSPDLSCLEDADRPSRDDDLSMTDASGEHSRAGYGPEPPRVRWPGGALVVISLVIGYEAADGYGARAGIWRLCRLVDRYRIPV